MGLRSLAGIKKIAIIGGGVVGGGWAAYFLGKGVDVSVYEPAPDGESKLRGFVAAVWPTLQRIGLSPGASPERLTFSANMSKVIDDSDFVQESAPDDRTLKRRLFAELDELVSDEVVIASSTSGIPMTDIQQDMRVPGRAVVGHPFNPPYLMPLVEVVPGAQTEEATIQWAMSFYTQFGKKALRIDSEKLGFIANRLQEAIWRETLHMVAAGEATAEQIDTAVVEGPGLRWAIMGPCLTFHLAGGDGGITHTLKHFENALSEPWCRMEGPLLSKTLCDRMEDGCRTLSAGSTNIELIAHRDEQLVTILKALNRLKIDESAAAE